MKDISKNVLHSCRVSVDKSGLLRGTEKSKKVIIIDASSGKWCDWIAENTDLKVDTVFTTQETSTTMMPTYQVFEHSLDSIQDNFPRNFEGLVVVNGFHKMQGLKRLFNVFKGLKLSRNSQIIVAGINSLGVALEDCARSYILEYCTQEGAFVNFIHIGHDGIDSYSISFQERYTLPSNEKALCLRQYDASYPIIHVHVPKTAGVSFYSMLKTLYPRNFHVDHRDLDTSWLGYMQERYDYDFVTGHIENKHVRSLGLDYHKFNLIAFIRDPIKRIVSHYYYCCSDAHTWSKDFISQYPTFDDYIEKAIPSNEQIKWLIGDTNSAQEAIDKITRTYCFIGLTDKMENSLNNLASILDTRLPKIENKNVNVASKGVSKKEPLTDAQLEKLVDLNKEEIEVFNYFLNNL